MQLSVVIPAFNEAKRLIPYLKSLRGYLNKKFLNQYEILVVDDGSTDGTASIAASYVGNRNVIRLPFNQGKGAAVRAGMLEARGALRLFADADGATPIAELPRLLSAIELGADLAIGSRAAAGGRRHWTTTGATPNTLSENKVAAPSEDPVWQVRPYRHLSGRLFSQVVLTVTGLKVSDTQCGFKLFRAEAAEKLFAKSKVRGFAFDVEVLYLAERLGFKVVEVPVSWHEVAGSKVSLILDSLPMATEVIRLRWRHRSRVASGVPDFLLEPKNEFPV